MWVPKIGAFLSPIPDAKLVYRSPRLVTAYDQECSDYPDKTYSLCGPGCQGVIFCDKGHKLNFTACPSLRPHCDPTLGQCGSVAPPLDGCPYWTSCDRTYQPDLFDCRAFTYCRSGFVYKYVCTDNSVYDSVRHLCSGRTTCASYSNKESCLGRTRKNIPFAQDSGKYVYCGEGNAPILLNCSNTGDEIAKTFNAKSGQCELSCVAEGKFANPDDATGKSYIECLDMNGSLEHFTRICPESTHYEPVRKVCTYRNFRPPYSGPGFRVTLGGATCSSGQLPCSLVGYSPRSSYGTIGGDMIFCYEPGVYPAHAYDCSGVDFWTDLEAFRAKYVPGCSVKLLETSDRKVLELACHKRRQL